MKYYAALISHKLCGHIPTNMKISYKNGCCVYESKNQVHSAVPFIHWKSTYITITL